MGYMPDGNTLAATKYDTWQAEGEEFIEQAEQERERLVLEFMDDPKKEREVMECLADVAGDSEFLHAMQRSDVPRMRKLLADAVDRVYGDEVVVLRANELGER